MKYKTCCVCKSLIDYDEICLCEECKKKFCKNCADNNSNVCHSCYGKILHKKNWQKNNSNILLKYAKN